MVKGVSRRVVVVQPDNNALFEQAIFLVRDYAAPKGEVLREACRIADRYLIGVRPRARHFSVRQMAAAFCAGAGLVGIIWAVTMLIL